MVGVEPQGAGAYGQVLVPPTELRLRPGERVEPLHDRGVEREREGRVEEVQEVRSRRSETLDLALIEPPDRREELLLAVAARAGVEEPGDGDLVVPALVDVGDA